MKSLQESERGTLRGIAIRPTDGAAMREVDSCLVLPGRGIDVENRKPGKREVTLLSMEAWREVCQELGTQLPWHTRRANLLVEGIDLPASVGHALQIGPVRILIHGETRPCEIMDRQFAGLRQTMVPNMRGGVTGQVLAGGEIQIGHEVTVCEHSG